jgi:glycosyltransferase involved in cell wall biosynthesis
VNIPLGLLLDLYHFRPDTIVSTEFGAGTFISAVYALIMRRRLVVWFYGTPHSERDISWKQRLLRKILTRMADAFVGMGTEARQYLLSLGLPSMAIFDAPNATGLLGFQSRLQEQERISIRRRLDMKGLCFLYVGQINERKGVGSLLGVWQAFCAQTGVDASLILVGDGPDRVRFENRFDSSIKFLGHTDPERLPAIFQAADIFVFPTLEDVWGLVVNEALTSGLPVICSRWAGCAADLIIEDKNGWVVNPENPQDFLEALKKAWDAWERKEEMSRAARETAAELTIARMTSGFQKAVEFAFSKPQSTFEPIRVTDRVNVDPS